MIKRYILQKEFNIFHLLLLNKEIVVSREKILEEVWGFDFEGEEKIVDVYINALRKKSTLMMKNIFILSEDLDILKKED